ncbi:MAG: M56 family metallopeptidase [Bacteroidetes bacterium]|nr:M56 family metallopeptidase [Bacteroidota bacterium]
MEIFLIKSAVCLGILFVFYKLFLERENIHNFKRFYLLGTLVVAYFIPFITFTKYIEVQKGVVPLLTSETLTVASSEIIPIIDYLPLVLWSIYGLGVLFFTLKFGSNLFGIIQKIRENPLYKNKNFFHVLLKTPTTPHTFFSYIFLNKHKFEANEIPEEVLLHEQAHACEKHSLDVLFIELLQIVFWFNPLIYFIKHSIKLNHEFLADRAVLSNGIDTANYQNILLAFSSNAGPPLPIVIGMANSINYSFIKKRITVMKTHTSKRAIWLRSIFLLPLLAVLVYGFSTKEIIEMESTPSISQINAQKVATINTDKQSYEPKIFEKKLDDNEIVKADLIVKDALSKEIQLDKIITIKINNEQLVVNGKSTSLANFAKTLDKITKNWTKDEIANCHFDVIVQNSDDEFIKKIEREYQKTKLYQANPGSILVPPPPPVPKVIIIDEIESDDVRVVEVKIANRVIQKTNNAVEVIEIKRASNAKISEVIEIKVAPKVIIIDEIEADKNVPPPPPIAAKVAVNVIESVNVVIAETPPPPITDKVAVKVIESVNAVIVETPPPPPDVDFEDLAAKGATFYLDGKEITSKKALRIIDKNKDLIIEIIESTSENPIVKLWKN